MRQSPTVRSGLQLRDEFFQQLGSPQQFQQLFEHLPGVSFFLKDAQSRMMAASQSILSRFGLTGEDEVIGRTDYDFFPPHLADRFVADDQQVMTTGRALINRVEIWYIEQRLLDWFLTSKLPVVDRVGRVIGVMGTVRSYEGARRSRQSYTPIDVVVEAIRSHLRERIKVADLAQRAELSPRQLHRKFMEVFGMSVQDFLVRTRIQAASDVLLSTNKSVAEIALEFGFCDQSAFTRQFRKQLGITPLNFRRQHRKELVDRGSTL